MMYLQWNIICSAKIKLQMIATVKMAYILYKVTNQSVHNNLAVVSTLFHQIFPQLCKNDDKEKNEKKKKENGHEQLEFYNRI